MKISGKCVFGGYDGVCFGAMTSLTSLFFNKIRCLCVYIFLIDQQTLVCSA